MVIVKKLREVIINIWIGLVYTMAKKPYHELTKDKENLMPFIVIFEHFESPVLIVDYYCVDPLCMCNNVLLVFYEVDKENIGEVMGELFSFYLDLGTWKIFQEEIINKKIEHKAMIDEFLQSLDDSYKERFLSRSQEAKKYAKENVLDTIDPSIVSDGRCALYSEIFDVGDMAWFTFEYNNTKFLIADQYCMNPSCKCNEVILTFIKFEQDKEELDMEFAIKLFFVGLRFDILESKCARSEALEIASSFVYKEKEYIKTTFKDRYKKMKEVAGKIKDKNKVTKKVQEFVGVGRNDPCPCGSGKKFKKCCGIG